MSKLVNETKQIRDEQDSKNSGSLLGHSSVILSPKKSRFCLPHDVKLLETLTSLEYLANYCRVSSRYETFYRRIFEKYKTNHGEINMESLIDGLYGIYLGTIEINQFQRLIESLEIFTNQMINYDQFRGIAAFSERYFYNIFRHLYDVESQCQKDILELLDFSSLKWKLSGVKISKELQFIFQYL